MGGFFYSAGNLIQLFGVAVRLEPRVFRTLSRHPTSKLHGKKGVLHI